MAVTFEVGLRDVTHKIISRDSLPLLDDLKMLARRLDIEFLFMDPSTFVDESGAEDARIRNR